MILELTSSTGKKAYWTGSILSADINDAGCFDHDACLKAGKYYIVPVMAGYPGSAAINYNSWVKFIILPSINAIKRGRI